MHLLPCCSAVHCILFPLLLLCRSCNSFIGVPLYISNVFTLLAAVGLQIFCSISIPFSLPSHSDIHTHS
uniref:Uncharacterized protein n=1 Tax=Octopus bimaculoides TaxID=37653 RepID=A0A0L8GXG8_OCTBM